jgi:multisubunit Na+/H+ antiporter MnhB subunit
MNFTAGLILIAVTIAMIVVARPANGESAPFLRVWIVGQLYALTAMVSVVIGVTIMIIAWPF